MVRALKTYTAEIDGVHEWIVAAPNQEQALAAFGIHRNLFAEGMAGVTEVPDAVEAATSSPGVPLRRMKGAKEAFAPPKAETSGWDAALAATPKRPKDKADRTKFTRAEAALAAFEADAAENLERLVRERAEIDQALTVAKAEIVRRRITLKKALEEARAAYRAEGGKD